LDAFEVLFWVLFVVFSAIGFALSVAASSSR